MHKWSFLLIACLAAVQSIAALTDRRFFDGRQQCSGSGDIKHTENLLTYDNLNRKNPEVYRLNSLDNNLSQQFRRYESRIIQLNRNINHRHIDNREQTLGRPNFIRDSVFDAIRDSRERSANSDRRFIEEGKPRENRRIPDRRAIVTEDRYSRLARDRRQVLLEHSYATSREQTRANRGIKENRRTDFRNQMRSTTEGKGFSGRHSEINIVLRDQDRENRVIRDQAMQKREIRGNRRTNVRNQIRLAKERNVDNERNVIADAERDQIRAYRDMRENRRTDVRKQMRSTTDRNIVSRDQDKENREIRDNRRSGTRNELRSTETNVEGESNLVFRDVTRTHREKRDIRRTQIQNQLRTTREGNEIRDNRRTQIQNQLRTTPERNEIRDNRRTQIQNQLRTTPERNEKRHNRRTQIQNQLRTTPERNEIRDNRRTQIQNQLRTTPERNEIRDNRRTQIQNQLRTTRERNEIRDNRRTQIQNQLRTTPERYEIRDNRRTQIQNQLRTTPERNEISDNRRTQIQNQLRTTPERNEIRDNRRTQIQNQLRTTPERNEIRDNRRTQIQNQLRTTRERNEIRDNRRTQIQNQLRTTPERYEIRDNRRTQIQNQLRTTPERNEIRDNRRTQIQNQLRTTPERNVDSVRDRFLERNSEQLVFREQTRAYREIRDNAKIHSSKRLQRLVENSQANSESESQRRSSDNLETMKYRQRDLHQNRVLLSVRENRSEDLNRANPTRVYRESDVQRRERKFYTRNDIHEGKSTTRLEATSQLFTINRFNSILGYRTENPSFGSHMDSQISPDKHTEQETSMLPWHYIMYSLQAIYIYSIISQLYTKTKGNKNFSQFTDLAFAKQIKAE